MKAVIERFSFWPGTGTESVALGLGVAASVRTARVLESYEKSSGRRICKGCDVPLKLEKMARPVFDNVRFQFNAIFSRRDLELHASTGVMIRRGRSTDCMCDLRT